MAASVPRTGASVPRTGASAAPAAAAGARADERARSHSLAELLRHSRFEILPLDGIDEQVLAQLPKEDVKVTVTASPRSYSCLPVMRPTDPASNVAGFHLYTFDEVARTERWRRQTLERLGSR